MVHFEQWEGFEGRIWREEVNVRDFIQKNYKPYAGDERFLAGPTEATDKLWGILQKLQKEERAKGGVLDMETHVVSGLTAYGAGYISEADKALEQIVGLQTDKPLKRAFMPFGGIKMAEEACRNYGYEPDPELHRIFTEYAPTHNEGVFMAYTPEMKKARHNKIITGLPDTYGRGRIVGDYRRVALYGIDFLIEEKTKDLANCGDGTMTEDVIRLREEIAKQIKALKGMKAMAAAYGFDISKPAANAKEACQWLYFGYLAAIKTQNGAAMSVGRISTFLDIYMERDLARGLITEAQAQELIDHMVMKFRMVKFARIPSYNALFSGDPVWATLEVGGIGVDGHIAFNEPYTSLASRTGVRDLTTDTRIVNSRFFGNDPEKVPAQALSVGVGTVTDSKEVLILINGHNKARALAATVEGGVSQKWTCSTLQMHNGAIIACDEAACGELTVDTYKYFLDIEKNQRL